MKFQGLLFNSFSLVIFYFFLFYIGFLILKFFNKGIQPKSSYIASLNIGLSSYTLFFVVVSIAGVNMLYLQWFLVFVVLIVFLFRTKIDDLYLIRNCSGNSFLRCMLLNSLLIICIILLAYNYLLIGYNHPFESVSGIGNWAYKSKLIYSNYGIPKDYIDNHATNYGKFSYPNSFPVLNASLSILRGEWNENLIRLNSVVIMLATYTLISYTFVKRWGWKGILMPLCVAAVFLAPSAYQVIDALYAEPLLLFHIVSASILYIEKKLFLALLCAFSAAWVKQEGILFCLLLSLSIFITEKEKLQHFLFCLILGLLFIIPWKMYTGNLGDTDFSFKNYNRDHFYQSVDHLDIFVRTNWEFYIIPCMLIPIGWIYLIKDKQVFVLWLISILFILIYLSSMLYSKINIAWHLTSMDRYMITPSLLLLIATSKALTAKKHSKKINYKRV